MLLTSNRLGIIVNFTSAGALLLVLEQPNIINTFRATQTLLLALQWLKYYKKFQSGPSIIISFGETQTSLLALERPKHDYQLQSGSGIIFRFTAAVEWFKHYSWLLSGSSIMISFRATQTF